MLSVIGSQMIQAPTSAPRSIIKQRAFPHRTLSGLVIFLLCALAIAPIAHISTILATTGADNLSNDYLAYTGLISDVLAGKYDWSHYFRDTFYRTHSVALPVLLHIADARFFDWSIYPELYFGIALAGLRLLLVYQACSLGLGTWLKWLSLPVLSLLVFSASQISVYGFGDATLTIGLALFGFSLGIWGLACRRNSPVALLFMLTGGLIASFSWGNGLVGWLVFLVALPLLGFRRPWHYAVWLAGFSLSVLPYILFLLPGISHSPTSSAGQAVVSLFNWQFVLNALGWPFANQIRFHAENLPEAWTIGCAGIGLAVAGLVLVWRMQSKELWLKCVPAFLFIAHGLLSLWQISVFRSLIAPWYTAVAMSFWIGLSALAVTLLQDYSARCGKVSPDNPAASPPPRLLINASFAWAGIVLVFLICVYVRSNLTYEDKTDYLFSRSPASASALRNYRSAPTYAEGLIFQWGVGNPGLLELLAHPLEQHRLSAFAPRQLWSLQGDFLLDRVKVREHKGAPDVIWTAGTGVSDRLPWSHFKHLNLLIAAPNVVTWTVDLPADLESAELLSAAAISESAPKVAGADGAWLKVDIRSEHGRDWLAFAKPLAANRHAWQPLKIDLAPYKGQQVTIQFSVLNGKNKESDWIAYRYPRIEIRRQPDEYRRATRKLRRKPVAIAPSNTDLSTGIVATTAGDLVLATDRGEQWQPADNTVAGGQNAPGWRLGGGSAMSYRGALDIALSHYSHFWVELAVREDVKPRALTARLTIGGRTDPVTVQIPLLPDSRFHTYTYDLKLLELEQAARLTGLSVEPITAGTNSSVEIVGMRFIRNQP